MVKQGKFASSTQSMQNKTQRYKVKSGQGKIKVADLPEYLMVRYHLTRGKRQTEVVEQTMLRLLDVLIPRLEARAGNLTTGWTAHLEESAGSVPWQYYKTILAEWPAFVGWLRKELPSVPLEVPLRLQKELEPGQMTELVAQQLAINWWLHQAVGQPERLAGITDDKITSLKDNFMTDGVIDWQIVATIYSTVIFVPNTTFDEATKDWLKALNQLV